MQVTLLGCTSASESSASNPIIVETNSHATIGTLVSTFCTQKGIPYNSKLEVFDASQRPLYLNGTLQMAGVTNGQTLYVGYGRLMQSSTKIKWPIYIAIAALVIGVVGILTMSLVYGLHGGVVPFDYGVVLDAGSSKTNTFLYQWLGNKYKGTGCVKQSKNCTVKGGIAKKDPSESVPKILNCISQIIPNIDKKEKISSTPLYFAATAGMRLLNQSDPNKVNDILDALRNQLNSTGLSVREVDIISGEDEGIYGWITTNFLKDTLSAKNTNPFSPVTYGALDMGGASSQIAFALPPSDENSTNPMIKRMILYGERHDVFAKSYLCFGRDEAARRYQALLITSPFQEIFNDACAPKGYNYSLTAEAVLNQPCTQTSTYEKWFKDNPDLKFKNFTLQGTSDYEECQMNVERLMNYENCRKMNFSQCFTILPRQLENQKFLAFATYYYTTDFLGLKTATLPQYINTTMYFCKKSYDDIRSKNPYVVEYCFNAMYIHQILVQGFGFNDTTWKNLEFVEKLDGKDLGWSLGYMINATNMVSAKKPSDRLISPTILTIFLVLFIIAVAATIVYLFHTLGRKNYTFNESVKSSQTP